jgi:hypothetical protein
MGEIRRFEFSLPRIAPRWLQRTVGGRLLASIGKVLDAVDDRFVKGVGMRFPTDGVDAKALGYIGRERRIRRGPAEDAVTYARRIRPWWEEHQVRGGPYALLRQMHAYLLGLFNVRIDVIYHLGARRWIDRDGTITRDAIVWDTTQYLWAQFWLVVWLYDEITTDGGDTIIDDDGQPLLFSAAEPSDLEVMRAIPREWNAAHVKTVNDRAPRGTATSLELPPAGPDVGRVGRERRHVGRLSDHHHDHELTHADEHHRR